MSKDFPGRVAPCLPALLFLAAFLALFIFSSGCLVRVDDHDKLSSDLSDPAVYNFSRYINRSLCAPDPYNKTAPCTCMVCSDEQAAWTRYVPNFLLSDRYTNFSLTASTCNFVRCNTSIYENLLTQYVSSGGLNCEITNPLTGQKEKRLCGPRFFMLGQGPSGAEYARAQSYCAGQLKMPVLWAVPNSSGYLTQNLSASLLGCYLQKDQMPVVVWHSQGRSINTSGYASMLRSLNQTGLSPPVDGPIMATTEALLDAYEYPDPSDPAFRLLNFTALDATANQVRTIKKECPKCLSVLALKPSFEYQSAVPDLCALDYLLNNNLTRPRPPGCQARYGARQDLFHDRVMDVWGKTDLVGVAFMANENANLSGCSPDSDVGRHLLYSRTALRYFYKPSVWYAVGIAPGPTATPGCEFSETDAGNSWESLVGYSAALAGSGVIGVAPYRFSDDPTGAPLNSTLEIEAFTAAGTLDDIRKAGTAKADPNNPSLVLTSSSSPDVRGGAKYVPAMSGEDRAVFWGSDGETYSARPAPGGGLRISKMAGRYGFMDIRGAWHPSSSYVWFANCEYYSRNRAPLWVSDAPMSSLKPGAVLSSPDGRYRVDIYSIQSQSGNETLFWAGDGRPYAARADGPGLKLYDRPTVEQATVQPLMFPTNGRSGAQCSVFDSTKMYPRLSLRANAAGAVFNLTPTRNLEDQKMISALSCGAGAGCMFGTPMPVAFCKFDARVYHAFPHSSKNSACTQYPQIDEAFTAQDTNPLFMRVFAVQESGLGWDSRPDSGASAPACAMAVIDKACLRSTDPPSAGTPSGFKTRDKLSNSVSAYCSQSVLSSKASSVDNTARFACGLGLMQCIDGVGQPTVFTKSCGSGGSYNPFNPADSACCGANVFKSGYNNAKAWLQNRMSSGSNAKDLSDEIGGEVDWYAAWMASSEYFGYDLRGGLIGYRRSSGQTLVEYVYDWLHRTRTCSGGSTSDCDYGWRHILRYNEGLDKCATGCPHTDCNAVLAGGSGGQIPFTP